MSDPDFPDYATIKAMAVALGRPASTLYALSDTCDPFFIPPAREAAAEWFSEVWKALDPPNGVHLRRLHYSIVSLPEDRRPRKLDGTLYQNTEKDWRLLNAASVDARAMGLVDAARFTDRRAGEPLHVASENDEAVEASVDVSGAEIEPPLGELAFGFSYEPQRYYFPAPPEVHLRLPALIEPYAIEVWAEKSTMNDVLAPIAWAHNVTLISGVGDLSVTHCHWAIERACAHGKPTRIFYISDHDPSGRRMPVAVARKVEYLLRRDGHDDLNVRLEPLVLTAEQVEEYGLPRIPIKDTDRGKQHFEDQFGEGATELDALEALFPGALGRIVTEAIDRYRQPTAEARDENRSIAAQTRAGLEEIRYGVLAEFDEEISDLRHAFDAMRARIEPRQVVLTEIAEDATSRSHEHVEAINAEVEAFYGRAEELWARLGEALEESVPDADEIDWASPAEPDEDADPLFDSARGYLEQIDRFKFHLGKPTGRRGNGNGGAP